MKNKLTKKQFGINLEEVELKKLNKLLSLIREPSEMTNFQAPTDTDTTSLWGVKSGELKRILLRSMYIEIIQQIFFESGQ